MPPTSSKSLLFAFYVIYYSIMAVMVAFGLLVLYLNYTGLNSPVPDPTFTQLLNYVLLVMAPLGIASGHLIFKQMLSAVDSALSLRDKLSRLQVTTLIRSACMEMPGLLGAVVAFVTGDVSFLLFTAIIAVFFVLWRPTLQTITENLSLSEVERMALYDPQGQVE